MLSVPGYPKFNPSIIPLSWIPIIQSFDYPPNFHFLMSQGAFRYARYVDGLFGIFLAKSNEIQGNYENI